MLEGRQLDLVIFIIIEFIIIEFNLIEILSKMKVIAKIKVIYIFNPYY